MYFACLVGILGVLSVVQLRLSGANPLGWSGQSGVMCQCLKGGKARHLCAGGIGAGLRDSSSVALCISILVSCCLCVCGLRLMQRKHVGCVVDTL